ncbi:hypothetical protein TYRP_001366 [Tyrophagus putrescentiae]|nr:hypothetical protein TYRP_001366 [Tyrophagus putrescentiae]
MSKYKRKKIVLLTSSDDSDDSDEVIFINESDKPNKKAQKLKNANADEAKGSSSNDDGKKANTSKTPPTQKITLSNSSSASTSKKTTTNKKGSSKTEEEKSVACTVAGCTKVFANRKNMINHRSRFHRAKSHDFEKFPKLVAPADDYRRRTDGRYSEAYSSVPDVFIDVDPVHDQPTDPTDDNIVDALKILFSCQKHSKIKEIIANIKDEWHIIYSIHLIKASGDKTSLEDITTRLLLQYPIKKKVGVSTSQGILSKYSSIFIPTLRSLKRWAKAMLSKLEVQEPLSSAEWPSASEPLARKIINDQLKEHPSLLRILNDFSYYKVHLCRAVKFMLLSNYPLRKAKQLARIYVNLERPSGDGVYDLLMAAIYCGISSLFAAGSRDYVHKRFVQKGTAKNNARLYRVFKESRQHGRDLLSFGILSNCGLISRGTAHFAEVCVIAFLQLLKPNYNKQRGNKSQIESSVAQALPLKMLQEIGLMFLIADKEYLYYWDDNTFSVICRCCTRSSTGPRGSFGRRKHGRVMIS